MASAELEIEEGGARVSGDLTFATVKGLYDRMGAITRAGEMPTSIDLSEVGQIDSAGLALLLEWQSLYRKRNGKSGSQLEVRHPPEALLKIARLCDAESYLSTATAEEAP